MRTRTWWNAAGVSASVKSVGSKVNPLSSAYSSRPSVVAAAQESPVGLRAKARVCADGRLRPAVPGTSAAAAGSPPGGNSSSSESVRMQTVGGGGGRQERGGQGSWQGGEAQVGVTEGRREGSNLPLGQR